MIGMTKGRRGEEEEEEGEEEERRDSILYGYSSEVTEHSC